MGLEDNFNGAVERWIDYCIDPATDASDVWQCDPFNEIVAMGGDALPFIRKLYDSNPNPEGGEFMMLPTQGLVDQPGFFGALMAFQYGETPKASDAGYEEIAQMAKAGSGREFALGLIKEHGLTSLVLEIVGVDDFRLPENVSNSSQVAEYTKKWLDDNMDRYVSN